MKNMMAFGLVGTHLYINCISRISSLLSLSRRLHPSYHSFLCFPSLSLLLFEQHRYSRNGKELSIPRKFMKAFPDIFVDSEIWYTPRPPPSVPSSPLLHTRLSSTSFIMILINSFSLLNIQVWKGMLRRLPRDLLTCTQELGGMGAHPLGCVRLSQSLHAKNLLHLRIDTSSSCFISRRASLYGILFHHPSPPSLPPSFTRTFAELS